jgi:hypothetical protein
LLFLEHVIDGACTHNIIRLIIKTFITCITLNKENMAKKLVSFGVEGVVCFKTFTLMWWCKFLKNICIPPAWGALCGLLHKFDDVNLEQFVLYFKARSSTPTTICIFFPSSYSSPQILEVGRINRNKREQDFDECVHLVD